MITASIRRFVPVVGLACGLVLAGCQSGADETLSPSSSARVTAGATAAPPTESVAPSDGGATSVFDLAIGDCFSVTGELAESVGVVDCEEPHVFEVFALIDHEAGAGEAYPGDDAIGEYGDRVCRVPFPDYVGHDYETSAYWITTLTPSDETWADGDREIVCTLRLGEAGEETTGSAEGSGR